MIMLSSTSDSDKSRRILSSQNGGRIRDVSFSSFLDGTEESLILKLAESEEISKSHSPNCGDDIKKAEEIEIDVFNADKYFNGRVEEEDENTNNPHEFDSYKIRTPRSISSKSSLNSRSSLLLQSTPQNHKSSYKSNGFNKKSFFSKLGCSCNDKNSVDIVDDQVGRGSTSGNGGSSGRKLPKDGEFSKMIELQAKSCVTTKEVDSGKIEDLGIEINRGEDFRFPVMKSNGGGEEEEDGRRKSLDVFGSDVPKSRDMSGFSVEKRMNRLTWDEIDIEIPSKSSKLHNNDSDSDTSSDLFEIESLSTNPSAQYFTRQTSYAPSETSIDWSVITASVTDFAAMSDSEEPTRRNSDRILRTINDHGTNGKTTRRNSGILSGCYNHKAVMVVGDAHRTTSNQQAINNIKNQTDNT